MALRHYQRTPAVHRRRVVAQSSRSQSTFDNQARHAAQFFKSSQKTRGLQKCGARLFFKPGHTELASHSSHAGRTSTPEQHRVDYQDQRVRRSLQPTQTPRGPQESLGWHFFNGDQILREVHASPVATSSGIKFSALTSSNSSLHFNGDESWPEAHPRLVAVFVGPNTTRRQS